MDTHAIKSLMTEAVTQLTAPPARSRCGTTPRRHVYHRQVRFSTSTPTAT
ncbi:hypothetical protein [Nonomuraea rubra]